MNKIPAFVQTQLDFKILSHHYTELTLHTVDLQILLQAEWFDLQFPFLERVPGAQV